MKNHAAFIIRDGDKLLFVQRAATKKSLPNIWAFPSGTIEEGERAEETAAREAKEELAVDVAVEGVIAVAALEELGARLHFVVCRMTRRTPIVADPGEIQAFRWMTLPDFFAEFSDDEIGHGLIWLRAVPAVWQGYFKRNLSAAENKKKIQEA